MEQRELIRLAAAGYAATIAASLGYLAIQVGFVESVSVWVDSRLPLLGVLFAGGAVLVVVATDAVPPKVMLAYSAGPLFVELSATVNFVGDYSTIPIATVEWGLLFLRLSFACLVAAGALRLVYTARKGESQGVDGRS